MLAINSTIKTRKLNLISVFNERMGWNRISKMIPITPTTKLRTKARISSVIISILHSFLRTGTFAPSGFEDGIIVNIILTGRDKHSMNIVRQIN